ncbi:MAG: glycosyltransferase family 4 protein [Acidobacteriota bacterium]|nr:glycosyltransferase family 4 protein [Acidobacteriota bacterium]
MKIAYVCADSGVALTKRNGSAAHVRGIVRAFVSLGHQVDLFMSCIDGAEELGVPVRPIRASILADDLTRRIGERPGHRGPKRVNRCDAGCAPAGERAVLRAVRHVCRNEAVERALTNEWSLTPPDLVYERYGPFGVAGGIVAKSLGIPHVLEVNAPLAWEGARHRGQALSDVATLLERIAFETSDRVVAVSEELAEHIVACGATRDRVAVVPNGVDVQHFTPDGPNRRGELEGRIVVGFTGSLKPWHGLDRLAEAFEQLAAIDPRLHLLVLGDGPAGEALHALARELPGRVTLTGAVPADVVPEYLRAIDIAVAPYPSLERFYFSPIKLLEYMASGCSIVASRVGQIERLIDEGRTGLLVSPGDTAELSRALWLLAADEHLRAELGRHAAAAARTGHAWDRRAREILELMTPAVR